MEKQLATFAQRLWKMANTYDSAVFRRKPREEFNHHCAVALFLARQDLPDGTDKEVWNRALSLLRKDMLGHGTMYENRVRLGANRKAMTTEHRWAAWGDETVALEGIQVDAELAADTLTIVEEFMNDLRAVLTDKEFELLQRVYVDGTPRSQLVDELALAEPKYASPEGRKQALNRINVAIHRARKKAMQALPERWAAFAGQTK